MTALQLARHIFFGLVEIAYGGWRLVLVITCAIGFALGMRYYLELERPACDAFETLTVEQTVIEVVYPDKIDTGTEDALTVRARISENAAVSQSVAIALNTNAPFAVVSDSILTTVLSSTNRTESWANVPVKYHNPRSAPPTLPIEIDAQVNQKQEGKEIHIRIDSTSRQTLSLIATLVTALGGLLGILGQVHALLRRKE